MEKAEDSPVSQNITWHHGKITQQERAKKLGQKGAVVWLTGLSGSGKSTVACEVEWAILDKGLNAVVLDGDNIRHGLNRDLGFSPADRTENIRRIGEVAKLFAQANVVVFTAFISPYRADRDAVRGILPKGRFLEVFCDASLPTCEKRDAKGLYAKARAGEIPEFTGISAPYEPPTNPDLALKTDQETPEESAEKVLRLLQEKGIIK